VKAGREGKCYHFPSEVLLHEVINYQKWLPVDGTDAITSFITVLISPCVLPLGLESVS
jgi:hypothetical protein